MSVIKKQTSRFCIVSDDVVLVSLQISEILYHICEMLFAHQLCILTVEDYFPLSYHLYAQEQGVV